MTTEQKLREALQKYADPNNWGYYDQSGCPKGAGRVEDACFIGPDPAREALQSVPAAPQEGKTDLRARIRLRANMIVRDHELQPQIVDVITDAMESVLTPQPATPRGDGGEDDSHPLDKLSALGGLSIPENVQEWLWHLELHLTEHDEAHAGRALRAAYPAVRDFFTSIATTYVQLANRLKAMEATPPAPSSPPSKADALTCKCGTKKECLGGRSAHISNWYCPKCEEAALQQEVETLRKWTDDYQPLPEDAEILAAHPMETGEHKRYWKAMRLVGAKRSKAALVDLVNWLLTREAQSRQKALEEAAKVCETLELTLKPYKYPSLEDRHLIAVTEAGCRNAFAKAIRALQQHTGEDGETKP